MTYSEVSDLIMGGVALPEGDTATKYVQDAADEIDSKLGFRYVTPIVIPDTAEYRAGRLLLKRINNWLASGRLVLALAAPREEQFNHAYGEKLVRDAEIALDQLVSGDIILPGAELLNPDDTGTSGPKISNLDEESNVESFYAFTQANPLTYVPNGSLIFPAGESRTW